MLVWIRIIVAACQRKVVVKTQIENQNASQKSPDVSIKTCGHSQPRIRPDGFHPRFVLGVCMPALRFGVALALAFCLALALGRTDSPGAALAFALAFGTKGLSEENHNGQSLVRTRSRYTIKLMFLYILINFMGQRMKVRSTKWCFPCLERVSKAIDSADLQ